jgi:hypothetical protein
LGDGCDGSDGSVGVYSLFGAARGHSVSRIIKQNQRREERNAEFSVVSGKSGVFFIYIGLMGKKAIL